MAHDLAGSADDQTIGLTGYNPAGQIVTRTSSNPVYAWTQHYDVSRGYAADALNRYTSIASTHAGFLQIMRRNRVFRITRETLADCIARTPA